MDFSNLLADHACNCGRVHRSEVKRIVMETGALTKLSDVIGEMGDFHRLCMICDENTYAVAGNRVEKLISLSQTVMLDPYHLHANERSVELVQERMEQGIDLLIAVGSGTIHDITRYVAFHRGIPFVSVPTAASVDGYVSNVAAMTWNGAKKTMTACAPIDMVADIDIIAEAPLPMASTAITAAIPTIIPMQVKRLRVLLRSIANIDTLKIIHTFIGGHPSPVCRPASPAGAWRTPRYHLHASPSRSLCPLRKVP